MAQLRARMEDKRMSMRELSTKAGLNESAVKQILNGTVTSPRGDTLKKLANALGCQVDELLSEPESGEHSARFHTIVKIPSRTRESSSPLTGDSPTVIPRPITGGQNAGRGTTVVAEISVRLGAGGGQLVEEPLGAERLWMFPTEWLVTEYRVDPGGLRMITIAGDSMSPTLQPGDKAMVDLSQTVPSPPGIFACWDGLGLVAKRLEHIEGSSPPTVRLVSDNPRYAPYERTLGEMHIVGRIVGRWERF